MSDSEDLTKIPIVWSGKYGVSFWGIEKLHPFDAAKGKRIFQLLVQNDLIETPQDIYLIVKEIDKKDLLKVHTPEYLRSLKWSINAAKITEIPLLLCLPNYFVQRGYLKPMRFQTAGSILAGKLALDSGWAINLGGGFHHCCSYRGAGYCPYADITLLIRKLFEEEASVKKAMIVDLDAHQGNGHERDFKDNKQVFILDMYNASIYPRDHSAKVSIRCAVELRPYTENNFYLRKLKSSLLNSLAEFKPDVVVFNAGTDILIGDPLGNLSITPEGVIARDEFVFSTCREREVPIVMLLSGGYLKRSAKVIADSILNLNRKGLLHNY